MAPNVAQYDDGSDTSAATTSEDALSTNDESAGEGAIKQNTISKQEFIQENGERFGREGHMDNSSLGPASELVVCNCTLNYPLDRVADSGRTNNNDVPKDPRTVKGTTQPERHSDASTMALKALSGDQQNKDPHFSAWATRMIETLEASSGRLYSVYVVAATTSSLVLDAHCSCSPSGRSVFKFHFCQYRHAKLPMHIHVIGLVMLGSFRKSAIRARMHGHHLPTPSTWVYRLSKPSGGGGRHLWSTIIIIIMILRYHQ